MDVNMPLCTDSTFSENNVSNFPAGDDSVNNFAMHYYVVTRYTPARKMVSRASGRVTGVKLLGKARFPMEHFPIHFAETRLKVTPGIHPLRLLCFQRNTSAERSACHC